MLYYIGFEPQYSAQWKIEWNENHYDMRAITSAHNFKIIMNLKLIKYRLHVALKSPSLQHNIDAITVP